MKGKDQAKAREPITPGKGKAINIHTFSQTATMVYINSEGNVSDTRKRKWGLSIIRDLIAGAFDFVGLFFRTLTASPSALQSERVSASCYYPVDLVAGD